MFLESPVPAFPASLLDVDLGAQQRRSPAGVHFRTHCIPSTSCINAISTKFALRIATSRRLS